MKSSVRVLGDEAPVAASERAPGQRPAPAEDGVDQEPRSVYEVLTRQMLEQVKADVNEIKSRINALTWTIIGAVFVELVMKVVG